MKYGSVANVKTWADGYGVFHARVFVFGDVSMSAIRRHARSAIVDDLVSRGYTTGESIKQRMIVRLRDTITSDPDQTVYEFSEEWRYA